MTNLRELAETYLQIETTPEYLDAVRAALGDEAKLNEYFGKRPAFGTAGIRGRVGPGYASLNPGIIQQTAQGYCAYLLATLGEETVKSRGVVIGYDARHGSRDFSEITACVFLMKGVKVYLFGCIVPTPYVAFTVRHLGCAGGVMVTASHNPATDNGYKVYWENGVQIVEPHDKGIAAAIQQNLLPWAGFDISLWAKSPLCTDPFQPIRLAYEDAIFKELCFHHEDNKKPSGLLITYSAMHGVGHKLTLSAFEKFGLPPFIPVYNQIEGNGDFPTCAFPNPEEGEPVFRLSFRTADRHGSTMIICQDPDADRVGLAVKKNGEWHIFHGNHTGVLLSWWRIVNYRGEPGKAAFLSSTVSTCLQGVMARKEGFVWEETLTGFKWLGNAGLAMAAQGIKPLCAFEEAIGFGPFIEKIADKDAVSTACAVAEMAHYLAREEKKDLLDKLGELYEKYGYYLFENSFFMCHQPPVLDALFARMRTGGPDGKYVKSVGPFAIARIRDMTKGWDSGTPDNKTVLPQQGGQMITFYLENGCILTIRTSGTEPKIKWYCEIGASDKAKAEADLQEVLTAVRDDLLQREKYNFKHTDD
jgi:phosphomannomutase